MKKFLTFVLAALASVATFAGTLSCAEAVEVAKGLEPNTPSEDEYIVEGYVVSVIKSSATDLRFWMADDAAAELGTFEAWVCTGDIVNKGDKVTVTGYIQWYVNEKDESDQKAEIADGTVVVVEPAPIDENYVEFNPGDFEGKGAADPGAEVSVEKNGVTLWVDKGYGTQYSLRVFKNSSMSISSSKRIVKLEFEFDPYNDKPYDGGLDKEVCVESTAWNFTASQSQARFKKISVTLGDGECSIVPPVVETITVAQAREIGFALGDNEKTTETYHVTGVVKTAYDFNTQYKNQDFYFADNIEDKDDMMAKRTTGDVVAKGDGVCVSGKIEKNVYNGKTTIQIYQGTAKKIPVGLNNVKATIKAKKVIENGQFMIEANGMRFNVLGARF